jgi:hypothetical protein
MSLLSIEACQSQGLLEFSCYADIVSYIVSCNSQNSICNIILDENVSNDIAKIQACVAALNRPQALLHFMILPVRVDEVPFHS